MSFLLEYHWSDQNHSRGWAPRKLLSTKTRSEHKLKRGNQMYCHLALEEEEKKKQLNPQIYPKSRESRGTLKLSLNSSGNGAFVRGNRARIVSYQGSSRIRLSRVGSSRKTAPTKTTCIRSTIDLRPSDDLLAAAAQTKTPRDQIRA